jgi:hypothetical protein
MTMTYWAIMRGDLKKNVLERIFYFLNFNVFFQNLNSQRPLKIINSKNEANYPEQMCSGMFSLLMNPNPWHRFYPLF